MNPHPRIHRALLARLIPGLIGLVLLAGCSTRDDVVGGNQAGDRQPRSIAADAPWNRYPAAFTFTSDDNDVANLAWAEVARRRGVRFTIFTVSDWVGWPNKLTWDDLGRLHDQGFEIGGHGVSHRRMTELDDETLDHELRECRASLERNLHRPGYTCEVFAYPYHNHDARVMAAASEYYLAARDGGQSSAGWPDFSQGSPVWGSIALYEVPTVVTIASLVEANSLSEEATRAAVRARLGDWKERHFWVNVYAHNQKEVDTQHFAWILEELIADGGFWIAPFGEVAQYYREMSED